MLTMWNYFKLLFLGMILSVSCNRKEQLVNEKSDSCVVIFHKIPSGNVYRGFSRGYELSYLDNEFNEVRLDINNKIIDTVHIPLNNNKKSIEFVTNVFSKNHFWLSSNDTISVYNVNGRISFINNSTQDTIKSVENCLSNNFQINGFNLVDIYFNYEELSSFLKIELSKSKIYAKINENAKNSSCFSEKHLKDSKNQLIERLNFFQNKDYYKFKSKDGNIEDFNYRLLIQNIVNKEFIKTNMKKATNGYKIDFKNVFNGVDSSKIFSNLDKKYVLLTILYNIIKFENKDDGNIYLDTYFTKYPNRTLKNEIVKNYFLNYDNTIDSNKTILINEKGIKTDLERLVVENRGKIIYVDLRASWCAPCVEIMGDSKKLSEKFNSNVTFVYLSIDKDLNAWQKANKKQNLAEHGYSYLILSPETSKLYKEIDLKTIPRFLIFNKEGELINSNAPSLDYEEIEKVINTLLK